MASKSDYERAYGRPLSDDEFAKINLEANTLYDTVDLEHDAEKLGKTPVASPPLPAPTRQPDYTGKQGLYDAAADWQTLQDIDAKYGGKPLAHPAQAPQPHGPYQLQPVYVEAAPPTHYVYQPDTLTAAPPPKPRYEEAFQVQGATPGEGIRNRQNLESGFSAPNENSSGEYASGVAAHRSHPAQPKNMGLGSGVKFGEEQHGMGEGLAKKRSFGAALKTKKAQAQSRDEA